MRMHYGSRCRLQKVRPCILRMRESLRAITGIRLPDDTRERALVSKGAGINGTVLLKGSTDIITDGNRVRFNRTGDPAMTVGGTGDVLARYSPVPCSAICLPLKRGALQRTSMAGQGSSLRQSGVKACWPLILLTGSLRNYLRKVGEWQSLRISRMSGHRWWISVQKMM